MVGRPQVLGWVTGLPDSSGNQSYYHVATGRGGACVSFLGSHPSFHFKDPSWLLLPEGLGQGRG